MGWNGAGTSGLEYQYQQLLAGRAGTENLLEDPTTGVLLPGNGTTSVSAKPGTGLELTIDESVQYVAEQALGAEIAASHAYSGIAVVEDVKTGDIVAMADLKSTTGAVDHRGRRKRQERSGTHGGQRLDHRADPGLPGRHPAGRRGRSSVNSAVTQVYEPGSVFKLVTFSAALARGQITPNTEINVPSSLAMGTYAFHDAESHGSEDLTASQIIAQSSNLGTIEIAQRLGEDPLWPRSATWASVIPPD